MKKLRKEKPKVKKRHIEDIPFYKFTYKADDLPLDPAKDFILEEIRIIKQLKSKEFHYDYELHMYPYQLTGKNVSDGLKLPPICPSSSDSSTKSFPSTSSTSSEFAWLEHNEPLSEEKIDKITKSLIFLHRNQRLKTLHSLSQRIKVSRVKEFLERYKVLGEKIGGRKKKTLFKRKEKPKKYRFDEWAFRTPEETLQEREKIRAYLKQVVEADLKRIQKEKIKKQKEEEEKIKKAERAKKRAEYRKKMDQLPNDKYMELLKKREKLKFKHMQALDPVDVDYQKQSALIRYQNELLSAEELFTNQIRDRTVKLMSGINVLQIETYPSKWIIRILPKIDQKLTFLRKASKSIVEEMKLWPNVHPEVMLLEFLFNPENKIPKHLAAYLIVLLMDLQEDYRNHIKRGFIKYLLKSKTEQARLQLVPEPPLYPMITIKAPVPWKCSIQVAKNRLEQVLMVNHPVIQALNMLWYNLYDNLIIVDSASLYTGDVPFHAETITEMIHTSCRIARDILVNDWMPRVSDLVDAMRYFWKDLISYTSTGCGRAQILFNCIHALLSRQLQGLVQKSLDHLFEMLVVYKGGNFLREYNPASLKLRRRPFMTLTVSVVGKYADDVEDHADKMDSELYQIDPDDPNILSMELDPEPIKMGRSTSYIMKNSGKMIIDPFMEDLPELFRSYFVSILKVGYKIPRLEYYLTQDESFLRYLHYIREDHVDMVKLYDKIKEIVKSNQTGPTTYLYPMYTFYFPILANKMKDITEYIFSQREIPSLEICKELMEKFNKLLQGIYFLRDYIPLNLFMLDNRRVNRILEKLVNELKNFVTNYFVTLNQVENRRICDEFDEMSLHAGERPKETPKVVALQNYLTVCREERLYSLKNEIKEVAKRVMFLLHYATLDQEDINLNSRTFLWPKELEQVLDLSGARLAVVRENLETALKERRAQFEQFLLGEKRKMDSFRLKEVREVLSVDDLHERVETVDGLMVILEKSSREAKEINTDENLLQLDQSFFPVLSDMIEKMEPIEKLWHTAYEFESRYESWYFGKFTGLNADVIRTEVEEMHKTMYRLTRALVTNPQAKRIAEQIRLKMDKFKIYLPALEAMCRQGLVDRHWEQISEEMGMPVNPKLYPCLGSMIDIDVMRILPKLEEISNAAGKEFELNKQLMGMQVEWTDVKFDCLPYRDTDGFILASVEEIQTLLDDHILKAQAMRSSPYIIALGEKATDWEDKLISMQDIIDTWLRVQSTWMYLEPIFSSEDIMRQMPIEGRKFKAVDRTFRKIMKNTHQDARVIQATDYPNLLKTFKEAFNDLEEIQKGLNMYLEKKRLFFARFFFLSNDEMLEILSETKDPSRVQPHMKKCFEGIERLIFDSNMEIIGMQSNVEEYVPFIRKVNPVLANGLVEKWLKEVEIVMIESMKEQTWQSSEAYNKDVRPKWVFKWPGQIVQCVSCVAWTSEVQEAIKDNNLNKYYEKCNNQISDLVQLVRGELNQANTITIEALIVLDVHARDIVQLLNQKKIHDIGDFNWTSQLRYYWEIDDEDKSSYVSVSMVGMDVRYGNEYLGNQGRLVTTPLTDRCFRTLMSALKLNLGGAPEGPAGTGKTETCKDLAKAVGKKCVVFNCSDGLDYKALGKFFKGLAQSGAWACFDEFNRIELEVLSVVAQQILTIQRAIARKVIKFVFEETTLRLDPTCTVFITMNPGYAGRTDLPDNLKVLFRTVAMMVPDYAMIGEITLYSNGFNEARVLAQKIVYTYKLCSEQLSSQYHYDYGMRAVKSVLLASAALRRAQPHLQESQIVLRAIIDVNLPKFLEQDVFLFEGIYKDLFPNVELPDPTRDDLVRHLKLKLKENKLQPKPWFIEKVLQIYEMILVRHGLMIVGAPMGGKTTAYQMLAEVLKEIKNDKEATMLETSVYYRIINPKAITMGQLYGSFDSVSHEWSDGVLANTFREMVYSTSKERNWIIFDGPVDAIWIENLNTVLDDNKKLCLMSGEIIQMTDKMNMIFETVDLEQASPATISRCGMVYMEPDNLGWQTYHETFVQQLEEEMGVTEIYLGLYQEIIDWLIPPTLEILKVCNKVVEVTPMYCYNMMTKFLRHFLTKHSNYNQNWFQQTFLYCHAWAYFSTITIESRKVVDAFLRKILYGSNDDYPKPKHFTLNRGQVYPEKYNFLDYRFDEHETWWPWLKTDDVNLPENSLVSDLIVPTKETGYIMYWADICVTKNIPLLLIGPTGTGKSAILSGYLRELRKDKYLINNLNFSARTTAQQMQDQIMLKLDRRRKGVFGPPVGREAVIFVDDVAMPARDMYGSQPPLELIRQCNYMPPLDSFEDTTLHRIFTVIGEWHFQRGFPDTISRLVKGLSSALIETYNKVCQAYLPTPAKSHYLFSLRDVTRVYQGIVMVPAKRLTDPEKLGRLWVHETYRVFHDRLVDQKDREHLLEIVKSACQTNLRFSLTQAFGERLKKDETISDSHIRDLMFGNYMEPDAVPKIYDEVEDLKKLEKVMQYYLNEYNQYSNQPMDLVLFRFAIEHISRISRVLQMPRGHLLLVGLGGSGRKSAVKLASSICDAELITVEVNRSYSFADWREDLKQLVLKAGISNKTTIFLFSDQQIKDEAFIEDINSLMNSGDLPNLFQTEDRSMILEKMTTAAKQSGKTTDTSPTSMYNYFTERVRESMHIVLVFSPIGDSFKKRIQLYPSLINCCTMDWFTQWPTDALQRVAENFIKSMCIEELEEKLSRPSSSLEIIGEIKEEEDTKYLYRSMTPLEEKLVEMVMYFNETVSDTSHLYEKEQGRINYVTPTSYLEMLRCFKTMFKKKYTEITSQRDRYTTGLERLDFAAGQVSLMQEQLRTLQPQLKKSSDETEKFMVIIERQTAEAEAKKEVLGADENAANEASAAAQALKDDCESDLQEAIPALNSALKALQTLRPEDITYLKTMKAPKDPIKMVMEAVCVLRGVRPDRGRDREGKVIEDFWGPSTRMLNDIHFLDHLANFDKDNIPDVVISVIKKKYINHRDFHPDKVKSIYAPAEGLCKWVIAMNTYNQVAKIVAPKKVALAAAEAELAGQMEKLNAKRAELQIILDKLQTLNDQFAEKTRAKKKLEDDIDNCEKKLVRAEQLIDGLGGEKTRWSENAETLHQSLSNVVGDVLLASATVAYLGYFSMEFRGTVIKNWNKKCLEKRISCSTKFSLSLTLGNPMQIRAWNLAGLPTDNFSIENGIIVTQASRWPLMIDPQTQANKWIKNMERTNGLKIIKLSDPGYMNTLGEAIKAGNPVLLENVGETIDSGLNTVLERNVIKNKEELVLKFVDTFISYNENFRFYITTCLRNPHYLPETAVMVTLINFTITEQGLREQLLSTVVVEERPDLQEKKESLIIESASNRDALHNVETKILTVLSSSEGNILEDENAIEILTSSKNLSEEIQAKQEIAVYTETEIDESRQLYMPVAEHSAVLFFCITELSNIDPMYQYSIDWFLNLFVHTIRKAPKTDNLTERLSYLNSFFTKSIYKNVCRSLFEKDKLVFSMVLTVGLLRAKGEINDETLSFFLTGGVALNNTFENPAPQWLSDKSWGEIVRASEVPTLSNFHRNFSFNVNIWKNYYTLDAPEENTFPEQYAKVDDLTALVLIRCLRPDRVVHAVKKYIIQKMGKEFIEPPQFDLQASYEESDVRTPLIFILSSGTDPMSNLMAFARERNMHEAVRSISLGQGQGPIAKKMIHEGIEKGHWVILQNCHVAESWMGEFENICTDPLTFKNVEPVYRLWCTSYPSKAFPVSVLQNSVKITNEAPRSLKMNMYRSFTSDPLVNDSFFTNAFSGETSKAWLRGVFGLVFFHAVVQERREYGPLGWNIPYEFNESDLKISIMQLKAFLEQYGEIPFEGHTYLTGECNYGGRVTDDKDRRLLQSLLIKTFNPDTIKIDNYNLSESGIYKVPLEPTRENSLKFIESIPLTPSPEVFGLHENANICKNNQDTELLLNGILQTQTAFLTSKKISIDDSDLVDPVLTLSEEILEKLPEEFDIEAVTEKYPIIYTDSMNTVLRQEIIRYNSLINFIKNLLTDIKRAVQGQITMIPSLEKVYKSISIGKLPEVWANKSYPSLKPLGSYINDLLARLTFFQTWIEEGEPPIFWISGFYFTQSFLTAVMQNHSRKNNLPIDHLKMKFDFTPFDVEETAKPQFGVYIKGLFLEGARWNRETKALDESFSRVLYDALPVIGMKPVLEKHANRKKLEYDCPVYKTSARKGVLSTTGHSTNFVMFIEINSLVHPSHWINRGTACLSI
uniref:CSON009294 protein n=1 Tax=Culicoides sonorensis TaxID=179676 RepID=A0A336M3T0_CULSO